MKSAKEIYDELIVRVKRTSLVEHLAKKRVVYNPEDGTQRFYLDDKLIGIKHVRSNLNGNS
jgi:hypothetical protein